MKKTKDQEERAVVKHSAAIQIQNNLTLLQRKAWNVLDKDGTNEWGTSTLLASAIIKNGICEYAYSPHLRERLYNPSMYARISLSLQNKFESKYAQAVWELCLDYLGSGREHGETPFISVEQFKKLMGIEN